MSVVAPGLDHHTTSANAPRPGGISFSTVRPQILTCCSEFARILQQRFGTVSARAMACIALPGAGKTASRDKEGIMRPRRLLAVFALISGSLYVSAAPALAQPPGNDTIDGATLVALPFSGEADTTEATTDEVDASLNEEFCGAPSTDASVWYTFTAEEDLGVEVFVAESDYSAGVIVASGSPGELNFVDCGPEAVFFFAGAGETYFVLAFDAQEDGGGNGGNLIIQIEGFTIEPPPQIEVTVDPIGRFDSRSGMATVSGTFFCSGTADFVELFGDMEQRAGRFFVRGFFSLFGEGEDPPDQQLLCDGTTRAWTADVHPDNGLFKGGKANVEVFVFACGFFDCTEESFEQQIRLSGRRR